MLTPLQYNQNTVQSTYTQHREQQNAIILLLCIQPSLTNTWLWDIPMLGTKRKPCNNVTPISPTPYPSQETQQSAQSTTQTFLVRPSEARSKQHCHYTRQHGPQPQTSLHLNTDCWTGTPAAMLQQPTHQCWQRVIAPYYSLIHPGVAHPEPHSACLWHPSQVLTP